MPPAPRPRPFAQVDVFSPTPYLGNPVAVVLDATGLADAALQRLARWTNLSETTFLLPPTDPGADYRVRIFTPGGELSFAGHPTLGSAHAWLEAGGVPASEGQVVQECPAGLVTIRPEPGPDGTRTLSFGAPPLTRTGPLDDAYLAEVVAAFGIDAGLVLDHQWVDNGPGWAVLRLSEAADVLALEPDLSRIPDAMVGAIGAYPEGAEYAYEMRSFAPRVGVNEDPVCGSMNAGVAQWLASTGAVRGRFRVSQGSRMGREGNILVTVDDDGAVWIGGATITCIRGTVHV